MVRELKIIIAAIVLMSVGCNNQKQSSEGKQFSLMDASVTNIDFNNEITESDSVNVFVDEYMYNGSGVGIGDFNNDSLPDIFFAGSMVSCKIYINKGNFVFEDMASTAGVQTNQWCTGVSVVDINNDGWQDIYVCSSHATDKDKRKNLLFINDGKMHFTEQAQKYGLADTGFATQAAFLDFDKDGDLDMYLLNHKVYGSQGQNNFNRKDTSGNAIAADRLYRNDGGVFHDVSKEAGIKEDGYGLGVVITDVNGDNWPDIYVANDYISNDLLWLNNHNGTFSNIASTSLRHTSYNSMGVDAADINNDQLPDLAVLDMMPETNERKKMMFNALTQEKFDMSLRLGYEPSFVHNVLQLNNGNHNNQPFYSEIGQLAGMSETDWSWSVLMADFDNDGWKDMHITNGLAKDVTNNDYVAFRNQSQSSYTFSSAQPSGLSKGTIETLRKLLDQYGSIKLDNYYFHNNGNLTFSNATKQSGMDNPSISNGAAYADLDNDGDLDLVINNMNQPAFVWKNNTFGNNYLSVKLKGTQSIGGKVTIWYNSGSQFLEESPVRGFSSSVDYKLHFGLGKALTIDSLKVVWPDDKVQVIKDVKVNQVLTLNYADAKKYKITNINTPTLFSEMDLDFRHTEMDHYDYAYQRVIPQKFSQLGPFVTTGDMNGDGLIDFFIGGAANQSGQCFMQQQNGTYINKSLTTNKPEEDLGTLLFDVDGDNDLDLLITGGSSEFGQNSNKNAARLYKNDGKGNFAPELNALPSGISQVVINADYDGDGDQDLFIGGRVIPAKYPDIPRSYIFRNDKGVFTDVTKEVCPALTYPGLITAAVWTDFNNDKKPDLVIAGDWQSVRFFKNKNGKLSEVATGLKNNSGMWRSLQQADIDGDGDMDYIAGNIGWNNKYHVKADHPMHFYAKDIDKNGSNDLVPSYYIMNSSGNYDLYPAIDRNQLAEEIPSVKKKYLLHKDYSNVTMQQLINDYGKDGWTQLTCETTSTTWIENRGNNQFVSHELPLKSQFAPVNAIIADDLDQDGMIDLLLAGNEYHNDVNAGSYDASYGVFLKGDGKGSFKAIDPAASGFVVAGDVRSMKLINHNGQKDIIVGINNGRAKYFRANTPKKAITN